MKNRAWLGVLLLAQAGLLVGCASQPADPKPQVVTFKAADMGDFANAGEPEFQALLARAERTAPADRQVGYLAAMLSTFKKDTPACRELRLLDIRFTSATRERGSKEFWVFDACGTVQEAEIRLAPRTAQGAKQAD